MSKYLIDTHILIWLAISPEKIPQSVFAIIENSENTICVSTVSIWEIAIKTSIKKLNLSGLSVEDLVQICREQGIEIMEFPLEAALKYKDLPMKENHRNPFDRALISLCISGGYTFLSADSKVAQYKADGLRLIS